MQWSPDACFVLMWGCQEEAHLQRGTTVEEADRELKKWWTYCRLLILIKTLLHTHTESLTIQEGWWVSHCGSLAASQLSSEWRQHVSLSGSRWCNHPFILPPHLSLSPVLAAAAAAPHLSLPLNFFHVFTSQSVLVSVPFSFFWLPRCLPSVCVPLFDLLKDVCVISRTECPPAFLCQCHQIGEGSELFCICQTSVCFLFKSTRRKNSVICFCPLTGDGL